MYLDDGGTLVDGVKFSQFRYAMYPLLIGEYHVIWVKGEARGSKTCEPNLRSKLNPQSLMLSPRIGDRVFDPTYEATLRLAPSRLTDAQAKQCCTTFQLPCHGTMLRGTGKARVNSRLVPAFRTEHQIPHKAWIRFTEVKDDAGLPFLHFELAVDSDRIGLQDARQDEEILESVEFVAKKWTRDGKDSPRPGRLTEAERSRLGCQHRDSESYVSPFTHEVKSPCQRISKVEDERATSCKMAPAVEDATIKKYEVLYQKLLEHTVAQANILETLAAMKGGMNEEFEKVDQLGQKVMSMKPLLEQDVAAMRRRNAVDEEAVDFETTPQSSKRRRTLPWITAVRSANLLNGTR